MLEAALAAHSSIDDDGWWFSASRTLAQVAMELDDLQTAARYFAAMPGHGVGDAQQHALRARLSLLAGETDPAAVMASMAVTSLASDSDEDLGTLMNGAIALMWCGEVLVDLGYGNEAARLAGMARRRIATAGVDDPILEAGLTMVEAGAARLVGDISTATVKLASIDRSLSPEFGIQVTTEKARLAWKAGDQETARALYGEAQAECERLRYPALKRLLGAEAQVGPAEMRSDPVPVEEWASRFTDQLAADHRPYALVATFRVEGDLGPYLEMGQQVEDLLEAKPDLGLVDGIGTDGEIWEMYVEGEDPQALWEELSPLLTPLGGSGSRVQIRRGGEVETIPLG